MRKYLILVVLLASSLSLPVMAATKLQKLTSLPLPPLQNIVLSTEGSNAEVYKASAQSKISQSQKLNRQVAQIDSIDEKGFLSESFIKVRDQFFSVKNADQLDALITQLSNKDNYYALDRDGQFLALQLIALKPYKSFIYRARVYLGKHTAVRSAIVTNLRIAAVAQYRFNSTPEQKALFDYLTIPQQGMGTDIQTDGQLESFLINELMPVTTDNYVKFTALMHRSEKPINWDNKVYASFANFSDSADRYAQIGLPEQYLILAGLEQTIAGQLVTSAYSLVGMSDMINRMAKEFGVDSMNILNKVDGLSAKKRFQILSGYPQLFKIKSGGAAYTAAAYRYLKASLLNTKVAWTHLQKNQTNTSQIALVLNPQLLTPFSRQINLGIANLDALFTGDELSSAVVNGEKITINFEKLFTEPPQAMSAFYPTEFNIEKPMSSKVIGGQKVEYRNYIADSATSWSYKAFSRYLPNAQSTNNGTSVDVSKEIRVLSQVWGAGLLGFSMSALVF